MTSTSQTLNRSRLDAQPGCRTSRVQGVNSPGEVDASTTSAVPGTNVDSSTSAPAPSSSWSWPAQEAAITNVSASGHGVPIPVRSSADPLTTARLHVESGTGTGTETIAGAFLATRSRPGLQQPGTPLSYDPARSLPPPPLPSISLPSPFTVTREIARLPWPSSVPWTSGHGSWGPAAGLGDSTVTPLPSSVGRARACLPCTKSNCKCHESVTIRSTAFESHL
jgi:hypothetical protein